MKRLKKLFVVVMTLIVGAVAALTLVGCDKGNYLKVATEAGFAPFEYIENGKYVGFDMELIEKIAIKMGYDGVKVKSMDFTAVITSVQRGAHDVAIAGITITPERAEKVEFSDSYWNASQTIIYKGEVKNFDSVDDIWTFLEGKKIGVATGFSGDYLITDAVDGEADPENPDAGRLKGKNCEIKRYKTAGMAATALANGNDIEVVVVDYDPAHAIAKKMDKLNACDIKMGNELYGIATKKGNTELIQNINKALKELKEDGTYDALKEKYFG